jgi:NADPH-dependent 2,4-dienoyl-CoA reductase/sulfur reductase-like enzyme
VVVRHNRLIPLAHSLLSQTRGGVGEKHTGYRGLHYQLQTQEKSDGVGAGLPSPQRVAVVGGGMAGLSTAIALQAEGHMVCTSEYQTGVYQTGVCQTGVSAHNRENLLV